MTPRNHSYLFSGAALLFLMLVIFALYSNTFQSPFVFDDKQIFENYYITHNDLSLENLLKISAHTHSKRRILPNISFAVNHYFGGSNAWGYHLVNIIVHICVAFVFFLLARATLALQVNNAKPLQRTGEIAFMAALIWAIHPLQTNAVTYIVQRMTSMATLFFLLSLLCYVKGRIHDRFDLKKTALFGASALFGIMALLSKEISGMLPVIILGYEVFFLRQNPARPQNRKKVLFIYMGCLLVFLVICLIFLGKNPMSSLFSGYGKRDFTLGQRLLTEPRIIFQYLTQLALPLPSRLNLAHDFQVSTGLLQPPQTLFAIIGLIALAWLIFFFYKRDRSVGFAIFWLLANLFIESSFIALELIFEHRMYMPSMFLILAFVAWGYRIVPRRVNGARFVLYALVLLLAFLTWQRNTAWQDKITLWTDVVRKSPELVRGHVNLGIAYSKAGDNLQAEESLLRAIELGPLDGHAYISLGASLERQERYAEAVETYKKAVGLKGTNHTKLHNNLAIAYQKLGDYENSIKYAGMASKANPYLYNPYVILGTAYFKIRDYRSAERFFLRAIQLFPEKGDAYVGLGTVYDHRNKLSQAASMIEKALTTKEVNRARAYNNLGIIYWRQGNLQKSADAAQKAIELDPELLDAYLTLGITYETMGRQDLAFAQFRKAWRKGLDMAGTYNEWAINFIRMNTPDKAILYLQEAVKLDPGRPASHKNLSRAYRMKGMLQEAATHRQLFQQYKNP